MNDIESLVFERISEIEDYLSLLRKLDHSIKNGKPIATSNQMRLLYSSVYIQLYNLVEAFVTKMIENLQTLVRDSNIKPDELSEELFKLWIRVNAKTHEHLEFEKRLIHTIDMSKKIISQQPPTYLNIPKGGGGNWDEKEINNLTKKIGLVLDLEKTHETLNDKIRLPIRNDYGVLALTKHLRNALAHGELSFSECGKDVTVDELEDAKSLIKEYIEVVLLKYASYVASKSYIKKPAQ